MFSGNTLKGLKDGTNTATSPQAGKFFTIAPEAAPPPNSLHSLWTGASRKGGALTTCVRVVFR